MVPEIEEIERLRKERGYSQPEVAGQMEIPIPTYEEYVYHDAKPGYDNLKKIEKWLEKNLDEVEAVDYGSDFYG